jgi:centrosomal protein CEP41
MIKPIGNRNILEKKIPKSTKYEHVKATLDTGLTVGKFLKKLGGESAINARFRREEHFRRVKPEELAKFVMLQQRNTYDQNEIESASIASNVNKGSLLIPDDEVSNEEAMAQERTSRVNKVLKHNMLLLDIRDMEEYEKCHISGAMHYEASRLTRSVNALTPEILAFVSFILYVFLFQGQLADFLLIIS